LRFPRVCYKVICYCPITNYRN